MTSVSAEIARLPEAVERGASRHARRLGRSVASDDLFLLALTELDEKQPAWAALAAVGVSTEKLLTQIRTSGDNGERTGALTFSPAYYIFTGLAQGFAATLGDGTITAEHVLLAILWTGHSTSLAALDALGVTREAITDQLQRLGIAVPQAALPPLVRVDWGERVWIDRDQLKVVLDHIRLIVGTERHWGFNYDGDRAFVLAERSVDTQALVREALAKADQ